MSKKRREILNLLEKLSLKSTIHGLPNIIKTEKRLLKLMWLLLFVLFTIIGCYSVFLSVSNFLKFEVVTKIEVIKEKSISFPALTISILKNRFENISLESLLTEWQSIIVQI